VTTQSAGSGLRGFTYVVLAVAFTSMIVQYSETYGRGVLGPLYDDVVYITDGLEYAHLLQTQGVEACLKQLWVSPPHSPLATFLAGASFVILGPREWAPYAIMGLVVLAVMFVADRLMNGAPLHARIGGALFTLSFPIVGTLPYYFRPDATAGLLTALGGVLMVRHSPFEASRRHQMLTGLCFALALLAKTPSFPFTLYMFIGSWFASAVYSAPADPANPTRPVVTARRWWGAIWPYWLPVLVLAAPYYVIAGGQVLRYVYDNVLGHNKEIWALRDSSLNLARFVWDGPAGRLMLGAHQYIVVALAVITGLVYLSANPAASPRPRLTVGLRIGSILLLAWLMPTVSRYNNEFIGATFAAIVLFVGVLLLRSLFLLDRRSPARWARGVPIGAALGWIVIITAVLAFPWPQKVGTRTTEWIETDNRVERAVYRAVANAATAGGSSGWVYVTSAANGLNEHLLRFRALTEQSLLRFFSLPYSTTLAEHVKAIERADYVVAGDQGTFRGTPATSYKIQDQILDALKMDSGLRLLATVPAYDGLNFYVFGRRPAFGGWTVAAGLGPPEGPVELAGGRMVRWGLGPQTVLTVPSESEGDGVVEFTGLTTRPGQIVAVFVNDAAVARVSLEPGDGFRHASFRIKWRAGPNRVELRYAVWEHHGADPRPMAVLFKELRAG